MKSSVPYSSALLFPLRGQNNVQGANDAGAAPAFYPGYQRVSDPQVRAKFAAAWGVELPSQAVLNLNLMMKEMVRGTVKGLFVMGEDLVVSEPNAAQVEAGLNSCEFVVRQDILRNETARFADLVLPAACFAVSPQLDQISACFGKTGEVADDCGVVTQAWKHLAPSPLAMPKWSRGSSPQRDQRSSRTKERLRQGPRSRSGSSGRSLPTLPSSKHGLFK